MPIHAYPQVTLPRPDRRAALAFPPGSDVPVIRQPFAPGDMLPFWGHGVTTDDHHLYDLGEDPAAERNLAGGRAEKEARDLLRAALDGVDAPSEQLARLGVA